MILAGGKGARLGALTDHTAKPAIHFGGNYRIIDYTLINCAYSGIDTVGVLTQYRASGLYDYLHNNSAWEWDKPDGGLHMLSSSDVGAPYTGTANAVYNNIEFIDRYNPEHVLILSGDHIYKMDYRKMLRFHSEKNADATISVVSVPWEETYRFGIIDAVDDGRITAFTEKPHEPKSNLASMGIYIYKWNCLKQYLTDDHNNICSDHDFGKDVIPAILSAGAKLYAYNFNGYWRDVGTLLSLWEANMDLLSENHNIKLNKKYRQKFMSGSSDAPKYTSQHLNIKNCIVSDGCDIYGRIENSVVYGAATVAEGALVVDSVLMPGAVIGRNTNIFKTFIGHNAIIGEDVSIGTNFGTTMYCDDKLCSNGISLIGPGVYINNNMKIAKNSHVVIWNDSYLLGNEQIDRQHKQLFELVSDLTASCLDGSAAAKLKEAMDFLLDYTVRHFSDEEALQLQYCYPEYDEHKQQHEDFALTISVLAHRFSEKGSSEKLSSEVTRIVARWLIEHIQREDKKIRKHIQSRLLQQGQTATIGGG